MRQAPFRLALRREGVWWIAYIAHPESTKKTVEMARIRMIVAEGNPAVKAKFIELNQLAVEHAMKEIGHEVAAWNEPVPAPESERSGNA
jgi:hypothetical protein